MVLKINMRNAKKSDAAALSRCPAMFVCFYFQFDYYYYYFFASQVRLRGCFSHCRSDNELVYLLF